MTSSHLRSHRANRRNEHAAASQLRLYVTNQHGNPITTGEVFIIGTDKSAELDNAGYALVDQIPFGVHSFSLTTPLGTYMYGGYDFRGEPLTFHVQVSNNYTMATPMVIGNTTSAVRKR